MFVFMPSFEREMSQTLVTHTFAHVFCCMLAVGFWKDLCFATGGFEGLRDAKWVSDVYELRHT